MFPLLPSLPLKYFPRKHMSSGLFFRGRRRVVRKSDGGLIESRLGRGRRWLLISLDTRGGGGGGCCCNPIRPPIMMNYLPRGRRLQRPPTPKCIGRGFGNWQKKRHGSGGREGGTGNGSDRRFKLFPPNGVQFSRGEIAGCRCSSPVVAGGGQQSTVSSFLLRRRCLFLFLSFRFWVGYEGSFLTH